MPCAGRVSDCRGRKETCESSAVRAVHQGCEIALCDLSQLTERNQLTAQDPGSQRAAPEPCHQLLCLVTSSSAMSSAHPHHWLARHPPACAAQGFSSGCPTQCMQTGMAAGIHRSAPEGAVRELRARQDQAKVTRLQCLERAEESPALSLVWTRQRMIPCLPFLWHLGAGTPPSLGDTKPQRVLVSFRNLQPQNSNL